jgi:hypothetical protein
MAPTLKHGFEPLSAFAEATGLSIRTARDRAEREGIFADRIGEPDDHVAVPVEAVVSSSRLTPEAELQHTSVPTVYAVHSRYAERFRRPVFVEKLAPSLDDVRSRRTLGTVIYTADHTWVAVGETSQLLRLARERPDLLSVFRTRANRLDIEVFEPELLREAVLASW